MVYTLKRSSKRRTCAIQVYPEGRVVVSVPARVSDLKAHDFFESKKDWVARALLRFQNLAPRLPVRDFSDGTEVYYLGKPLKIKLRFEGARACELFENELSVFLPWQGNPELQIPRIKRKLSDWFTQQAVSLITGRVHHFEAVMGLQKSGLQFKHFKGRWGSCKKSGELSFNLRLIHAPLELIDYVVIHELAHLKHHHHGPRFWALVKKYFPDPKNAKRQLQALDYSGMLSL